VATEVPGLNLVVTNLHVIDRILNKLVIMNKKLNSLLMILAFISTNAQSNELQGLFGLDLNKNISNYVSQDFVIENSSKFPETIAGYRVVNITGKTPNTNPYYSNYFAVIDNFVIPNVHKDIFPALSGHSNVQTLEALGIIESFSVASLIEGADAAVKAASVKLIEVRLAMALGGKAFCTLTGEVAAVQAAVDAGAQSIADKGLLVNKVVIPQPRKELLSEMI